MERGQNLREVPINFASVAAIVVTESSTFAETINSAARSSPKEFWFLSLRYPLYRSALNPRSTFRLVN